MDAEDIARLSVEQEAFQDSTDPAVKQGWAIANIGDLEWAMQRLGDLEAEAAENEAALADAHKRLDARAAELAAKVNRGIGFFRASVLRYMEAHRNELLKGGARKSRTLLYGTLGWRTAGGRLKVVDKDALTTWLMSQPVELGLARVKVEPDMRALQAHCLKLGKIPPGTELEAEREAPYVKAVSPGTTLAKTKEEDHAAE